LIGPLQTNKAEDAVALFNVIETLDREKLARALAQAAQKRDRSPRVLVQMNTGAEPQKAGVLPARRRRPDCGGARNLWADGRRTDVHPSGRPAAEPHFALLRDMAERNGLSVLSMGMSGDYEAAIRCGATHVRVGTALFGERNRP
jgi:PLP dependent protein